MNKKFAKILVSALLMSASLTVSAQERRPIDARHPLWLVHIDVWNKADPQKIIDQIPADIRPYVCLNLSMSCAYDTKKNVYQRPQSAIRTYKSWASVCQHNNMWFTCQPASGGHTHIQDNDLETFEYFYRQYPNFLGWNYAEQFWGFDEKGDKSSSTQTSRIALFAKLVPMAHQYGGFLTVSFCGNQYSHSLSPLGMLKRNADLLKACQQYPEAMLWLYKYTHPACFYNNESVTMGPFVSGLSANYGVRYDNCGWNDALDQIGHKGLKYPTAAGLGTVMEQTGMNGGAVWDGPELIWTEDFTETNPVQKDGYTCRNWTTFDGFRNGWIDLYRKIIDGTLYIPSRQEVLSRTRIAVINDVNSGNMEEQYGSWSNLYHGLYKQDDPFNPGDGNFDNNRCYFKSSGRYPAIPIVAGLYDEASRSIPLVVKKSEARSRWSDINAKVNEFNQYYPEISQGDLFVARYRNQLVTYTPYTYLNTKKSAQAVVPFQYNTCSSMKLEYGKLSSGVIREYNDHVDLYLNNYRTDTTTLNTDRIIISGASAKPSYTYQLRGEGRGSTTESWDAASQQYTVEVRHNGPVDLRINCSGAATGRLTDAINLATLSASLPKQPSAFNGQLIVEAEDMDRRSVQNCCVDPYGQYPNERGNAGNGFVDMGTNPYGFLRHVFNMSKAGNYRIAVRYMNTAGNGSLQTVVNGQTQNVAIGYTGKNVWKKVEFTASLKEGINTLILNNKQGIGMYIDQVIYTPAEQEDEKFLVTIRDAEHGTATSSVASAAEGTEVRVSATPDAGYGFKGWEVIHGDIQLADDGSFIMPDDNITLQPIYVDQSAAYTMNFSNVMNGGLPEGWRAVMGGETHSYPNIYGSGARTMAGFNGYQGKGLYWRENSADYGMLSGYPLTLEPGEYTLSWAMAGWVGTPSYTAQILTSTGNTVAKSATLTATPDVNRDNTADVSGMEKQQLSFTVQAKGDYVIKFASTGGWQEYLLFDCEIKKALSAGIETAAISTADDTIVSIVNASGIRQSHLQRGLNIVTMKSGKVRKIILK